MLCDTMQLYKVIVLSFILICIAIKIGDGRNKLGAQHDRENGRFSKTGKTVIEIY